MESRSGVRLIQLKDLLKKALDLSTERRFISVKRVYGLRIEPKIFVSILLALGKRKGFAPDRAKPLRIANA